MALLKKGTLRNTRGRASIPLGVCGLAFVVLAVALGAVEVLGFWRSSAAAGQIVKLVDLESNARRAPVVTFTDGAGHSHTFMAGRTTVAARYDVGESVKVFYNPDDPSQARIADFSASFTPSLLAGSFGALLLLIGGLSGPRRLPTASREQQPGVTPEDSKTATEYREPHVRLARRGQVDLQYHPFNAVAVKPYVSGLGKPASARVVKLTESRQSLAQGSFPVALAEFLAHAAALAYHEDGAQFLATRCPRVASPHVVHFGPARALCFLFEGTIVIAVADPDGARLSGALYSLFSTNAGAREFVPEDTVWDAAPRARAPARTWNGLRSGVEDWLRNTGLSDTTGEKPPILLTGHHRAGAVAMLAGYEFAKRGRNVAAVTVFGRAHPGGRAFGAEYAELGLDERTLHVITPRTKLKNWTWPFAANPPGLNFTLPESDAGLVDVAEAAAKDKWIGLRTDIERGYALALTNLIYDRLLQLYLAEGRADPAREAYSALSEHLTDSRGVGPQDAALGFATLEGQPALRPVSPVGGLVTHAESLA